MDYQSMATKFWELHKADTFPSCEQMIAIRQFAGWLEEQAAQPSEQRTPQEELDELSKQLAANHAKLKKALPNARDLIAKSLGRNKQQTDGSWISIKEEMPKENTPVLVSDGKDVWSASYMTVGDKLFWSCHGFDGYDMEPGFGYPTHWKNLPELPA